MSSSWFELSWTLFLSRVSDVSEGSSESVRPGQLSETPPETRLPSVRRLVHQQSRRVSVWRQRSEEALPHQTAGFGTPDNTSATCD